MSHCKHLINITVNMLRQMLWKKKVEQHESQQETKIMFRSGENTSVMDILKKHIIKTSEFEAFVV